MGSLLGSLLPLAFGVALSPIGVIAIIVVLFTRRPVLNGICFDMGWLAAIAIIFTITYLITRSLTVEKPSNPPQWVGVVHIVIGIVLVLAAAWVWWRGQEQVRRAAEAHRRAELVNAAPQLPGWMKSVPSYRAVRCLLLGFVLCAINPVDASCILGAAVDVRVSDAPTSTKVIAVAIFTLIAVSTVALPVAYVAVRGASAARLLERMRDWIGRYNGAITAGFFVLIGISQLVKGVGQL
jgi:threonine/homoserine/homoserine lactone efflux protein